MTTNERKHSGVIENGCIPFKPIQSCRNQIKMIKYEQVGVDEQMTGNYSENVKEMKAFVSNTQEL